MFNEYLFPLCDCSCLNVMCVCLSLSWLNQKDFWSFYLLLEVFYITHVFQVVFVWKTWFLGVFLTHFASSISLNPITSFNGPILNYFQLWTESFATGLQLEIWPMKIWRLISQVTKSPNFLRLVRESTTREMPRISFLKSNLWDICFKLLPSSPKPLFQCFYIKTQLNLIVFHSINIS